MRIRDLHLAICVLALTAVPLAAQTATPAAAAPSTEDCLACHADAGLTRANGTTLTVPPTVFSQSIHGTFACVDCHADLATATDFPHAEKLQKVQCQTCHEEQGTSYYDSVHERAIRKSGLSVAATCSSCHGTHDVRPRTDATSRVHRANIANTCATCHSGILPDYSNSVHAQQVAHGNTNAAVCSDCHTSHRIQRHETEAWRLSVIEECGTCHVDKISTYRDTYHGKVTELGFTRTAACADCHGNHRILPASNPASTVSAQNIVATCQKCHAHANANFAQYDPHADKHNRQRSPGLYWASRFMQLLLAGVFLFFGVHTLLWFPRSYKARHAHPNGKGKAS